MKTFAEIYETLPGNGWLSKNEASLLYWHCSQMQGPILEVGCYEGRSSVLLASFGRPLYCVDPFDREDTATDGDKIEEAWHVNMRSRELFHAVLFKQPIEEWEVRPVEFAYLDGEHSYDGTIVQIEKAQACGAKVIAVHDVNDSGGGFQVKRAAVEALGQWTDRVERLAVWILQ